MPEFMYVNLYSINYCVICILMLVVFLIIEVNSIHSVHAIAANDRLSISSSFMNILMMKKHNIRIIRQALIFVARHVISMSVCPNLSQSILRTIKILTYIIKILQN